MRTSATKIHNLKQRSNSSNAWLMRHVNDEYVQRAQTEGWRSRAAYKLLEINKKFSLINPGDTVIDLGAAPGSWSQVLVDLLAGRGKIVALDMLEMEPIVGVNIEQGDFMDPIMQEKINIKAHVILSDISPNTTGHKDTDHIRIISICQQVFEFSCKNLNKNGNIVVKIFQGGAQHELLHKIKQKFSLVKHFKPLSSRKESSEMYMIAKGFKDS